jgi:hypothetical protein
LAGTECAVECITGVDSSVWARPYGNLWGSAVYSLCCIWWFVMGALCVDSVRSGVYIQT